MQKLVADIENHTIARSSKIDKSRSIARIIAYLDHDMVQHNNYLLNFIYELFGPCSDIYVYADFFTLERWTTLVSGSPRCA